MQEYNQWDKFNVDDQLKAFDEQERKDAMVPALLLGVLIPDTACLLQVQKKKEALERQRQKNEQRLAKRDEKQVCRMRWWCGLGLNKQVKAADS